MSLPIPATEWYNKAPKNNNWTIEYIATGLQATSAELDAIRSSVSDVLQHLHWEGKDMNTTAGKRAL